MHVGWPQRGAARRRDHRLAHAGTVGPVRRLTAIPALDGLRFVAVLGTAAVHLAPHRVPGGIVGVDVFFVLSGFLITSLLLEEQGRRGSIDLRRFYTRRARRLYPALLALLAVFVVWSTVRMHTHPWRIDLITAALGATYVENWVGVVGHSVPWEMDHLWSLAVEEQFYLVVPLALLLLLHRRVAGARLVQVLALLGALSAGADALSWVARHQVGLSYGATPLHATGLLLGCALGAAYTHRAADRTLDALGRSRLVPVACLAGLVTLALTVHVDQASAYLWGIPAASALAVVLIASLVLAPTPSGPDVRRLLRHPVPVRLGRRTYSVYLWQNPVQWALTGPLHHTTLAGVLAVNAAVTLAVAELSYRFVERRWLDRRPRGAPAGQAPAAA